MRCPFPKPAQSVDATQALNLGEGFGQVLQCRSTRLEHGAEWTVYSWPCASLPLMVHYTGTSAADDREEVAMRVLEACRWTRWKFRGDSDRR